MQDKITRPEELLSVTPEELFKRVRPILRSGGLLASHTRLERLKAQLLRVCWELGELWKKKPKLGERAVGFDEYLAATLCNNLRVADRAENPHLYGNGRYGPSYEPVELREDLLQDTFILGEVPGELAQPQQWTERLTQAGKHVAQPSITALIDHVESVASGNTRSAYRLARKLGYTTDLARNQPATAAFIAISDYVAAVSTSPVATA
jgi:hypothetical protein